MTDDLQSLEIFESYIRLTRQSLKYDRYNDDYSHSMNILMNNSYGKLYDKYDKNHSVPNISLRWPKLVPAIYKILYKNIFYIMYSSQYVLLTALLQIIFNFNINNKK